MYVAENMTVAEPPGEAGHRAKHRSWVKWGIVILVIIVAVGTFYVVRLDEHAQVSNDLARHGPELKSDLALSQVSAYVTRGGEGEERDVTDASAPVEKRTGLQGAGIDLTLGNVANGTSLVTKASITFNSLRSLPPCASTGGPLVITANYQFTLPEDQGPVPPAKPFTLTKTISHEVVANKHDRLMLTVGMPTIVEGVSPWVAVVDVVLEHDGGQQLKTGPIAILYPGYQYDFYPDGDDWKIPTEPNVGCIAENRELLAEVLKTPNLVLAKEVASLDRILRNYRG
ncbi:hypothetical protein ACIA8O_37335 [Kitasatospora sp. NPDC051853]|uniref:hypothetical protein n=1 Tax=Kitasatospora sp. NPDC051853 TaxID=3364058 RepID=UPI0037A0FEAD